MSRALILPLALLLTAIPVAASANGTPDSENGRYSFNRVEEGILRLDQRTGQVSLCARRNLGWACHPVPDERAALEEEIGRLQRNNAALKKELLARGVIPPAESRSQLPAVPETPSAEKPSSEKPSGEKPSSEKPALKLPSDAEIDRAMAMMERLWKRLVDMVQRWQREMI